MYADAASCLHSTWLRRGPSAGCSGCRLAAPGAGFPRAGKAAAKRIAARERRIKAQYGAYSAGQAAAAEAEDALDLVSNAAGRAADEAQAAAASCGHLRAELARRQEGVEAAQARLEAARVRLALEGQQLGSLQQKVWGSGRVASRG